MKVLTISCHPDDIEIAAGGTILRYVQQGDEVTICHVANGSQGHAVILPEELRKGKEASTHTVHLRLLSASALITNKIIAYRNLRPDVNFQLYQTPGQEDDYDAVSW